MKILHFTDIHGNLNVMHKMRQLSEQVDVVVMTGDLTLMGRDLKALLSRLNMFKAPVLIIHGNHEDEEEVELHCQKFDNVTFLHKKIIEIKGTWFGAYGTHGLSDEYPDQERWVKQNKEELAQKKPLVWLDHPPPAETALDKLAEDWHVGSRSLRKFIEEFQPTYVFCGHIHETFGQEDMVGDTVIINSGPSGRIIELEERT